MAAETDVRSLFGLDPNVTFLNHGSFGACPLPVLEAQSRLRATLERNPVRFLGRELEGRLDEARRSLGAFVGARPDDLAFVTNATTGVNTVLRSIDLGPSDELLITDHAYNACRNALDFVAARTGARVVVAAIPFPIEHSDAAVARILEAVTAKTRLALIDHVTSPTGLVLPIAKIVEALRERGVETLVDGAHAPGMVPLDLEALGAAYYTGNCHKWLCTPKGCALLHVRRDKQASLRPLVISHGASSKRTDRPRFRLELDFTGTQDFTPYLVVPDALRFLSTCLPGGWPALAASNRTKALGAQRRLSEALGMAPPAPEGMIGALASIPLPDGDGRPPKDPAYPDALQESLFERFGIEVPVVLWPRPPKRLLRISAQIYNAVSDYERLCEALAALGMT